MSKIWFGCVESRADPIYLGRCRVRIVGVHTENKGDLPTEDLPWAMALQPITSAGITGVGTAPVGLVEGSWVAVMFLDEALQHPIMIGTISGFNENMPFEFDNDDTVSTVQKYDPVLDTKAPAAETPAPIPDSAVSSETTAVSGKVNSTFDAISQKATSLVGASDGITNKIASQFTSMTNQIQAMGENLVKTFGDRIDVGAITKDLQDIVKIPGGILDAGIDNMAAMISAGQASLSQFSDTEAASIVQNIHEKLADLDLEQINQIVSEGFDLSKFNVLQQVAKGGMDITGGEKSLITDITKSDSEPLTLAPYQKTSGGVVKMDNMNFEDSWPGKDFGAPKPTQ